jgi:hypothetical protein
MEDYDEIIESSIEMLKANSSLKIYEGEYIIKSEDTEIIISGTIQYDWFPHSKANFSGEVLDEFAEVFKIIDKQNLIQVIIDGLEFGKGFITNTNFSTQISINGTISGQAILGDRTIAVQKLRFSIPNIRDFHGLHVTKKTPENEFSGMNRLKLENDKYLISIDKSINYKKLRSELDKKGGYLILYAGELKRKKGAITHEDVKDFFYCLNTFLTFINGRRTSALFIHGIHEDEIIWRDYTNYHADIYKFVPSWPEVHSVNGLNELFQNFSEI